MRMVRMVRVPRRRRAVPRPGVGEVGPMVALGLADRESDRVGPDLEVAEQVSQTIAGQPARADGGPRGFGSELSIFSRSLVVAASG